MAYLLYGRYAKGSFSLEQMTGRRLHLPSPLVGCALIPLKKRRCLGAALPPDDGTPQAAIEWVRFPAVFIKSK